MEASYDEDLSENTFLQVLRCEYSAIFERAVDRGWIICVPRSGSFTKSALVEEDFLRHVLMPEEDGCEIKFRTLAGKEVKVSNRVLTVDYDIAKACCAHLLFEETFYADDQSKYTLWCIEHPLEQNISASRDDVLEVTNVREALNVLWTEVSNIDIILEMNMAIEEFQEANNRLEDEPLHSQRDRVGALYSRNLRILLQDRRIREKTEANRHFLQTIKITAETYTLFGLRHLLPRSVSARTAIDDSIINKTIKNLHDLQLRDLGVRADIYDGALRGKLELSCLNDHATCLGKIGCLKKVIRHITEGTTLVSSDDILPVLIFLVIRAGLPNWAAQIAFMKQFRFSVNSTSDADESGFLITSLEAAIEHIRSGMLNSSSIRSETHDEKNSPERNDSLENLFAAIRRSDLGDVKNIIVKKAVANSSQNLKLCHPLCCCEKCERRLAGANSMSNCPTVHSRDDRGMTAIHIASLHGHVDIVDFLLEHDADPNDQDADGTTPLHCTASRGHHNTLLLLLHANADPGIADSRGNTPLHLAADHGHEGCVNALLYFTEQMRLPLNKSPANFKGETPLHHAAKWGYGNIVEILMEHGANPRATNRRNQMPFDVAHSSRVSRLMTETSDHRSRISARASTFIYRDSASGGAIKKVEKFGKSRANLKKAERLLAAIAENDLRLACFYLGLEGPEKNSANDIPELCHPLCHCERCATDDSTEEQKKVTRWGVNISNDQDETALHIACLNGRTEMVEILLDAGANVNSKTLDGRTPLHLSCMNGSIKIVKMLVNCGNCDVNATDNNGESPLHVAARTNNNKIVQLLIKHGADTKLRNSNGLRALQSMNKVCANNIHRSQSLSEFRLSSRD